MRRLRTDRMTQRRMRMEMRDTEEVASPKRMSPIAIEATLRLVTRTTHEPMAPAAPALVYGEGFP